MNKRPISDLNTREDISFLVHTFYARVREDELLGPIFNKIIHDWPAHLERITNFWETSLLLTRSYLGNPGQVHREVDRKVNHSIEMEHFGRWLHLWFNTIDAYFTGQNATLAKNRARNMSTHMFLRIYEVRPQV